MEPKRDSESPDFTVNSYFVQLVTQQGDINALQEFHKLVRFQLGLPI